VDISLVAAIAKNGVIGHRGAIPWYLPADLKKFRAITIGHTVVMGRRTWESILASPLGGPLPGRQNLVVSSSAIAHPGVSVVRSFDAALAFAEASKASALFAIGGAAIYREALPRVTVAHITDVVVEPSGDAFFPAWDRALFAVTEEISWPGTATIPAAVYRRYLRR
jgi:dihydrofolate reductase